MYARLFMNVPIFLFLGVGFAFPSFLFAMDDAPDAQKRFLMDSPASPPLKAVETSPSQLLFSLEEEELPSQFIRKRNQTIRPWLPLPSVPCCERDYNLYGQTVYQQNVDYLDQCYDAACKGNARAAEFIAKVYMYNLFPPLPTPPYNTPQKKEEENRIFLEEWDVAKRFARYAAERGSPDTYIMLTASDYGRGKEMKEHTKWAIKQVINRAYDPKSPYSFFAFTNSIKPVDVARDSLKALERYISGSYRERSDLRSSKANMYLKGFFGQREAERAKAFRIAFREWYIAFDNAKNRDLAGGVLYDFMIEILGKKDESLCVQAFEILNAGVFNRTPSMGAFEFFKKYTCLLQRYNFLPEAIITQLRQHKTSLVLDLHGKRREEGIEQTLEVLEVMCANQGALKSALIITGKGKHSQGGQPVLKPAIVNFLKRKIEEGQLPLTYQEDSGGGAYKVFPG